MYSLSVARKTHGGSLVLSLFLPLSLSLSSAEPSLPLFAPVLPTRANLLSVSLPLCSVCALGTIRNSLSLLRLSLPLSPLPRLLRRFPYPVSPLLAAVVSPFRRSG